MDLLFKRSVKGTVLATVIMVIFQKCNHIQGLDYKWCSYRYYSQALPWAAASSVCEQKGLKLAVMTEQASYNFVTEFIKESVSRIYSDVQSSMWIGLHKDYAGNLRHDDCKIYTAKDFNPTQNLENRCVYLDAGGTTFKADECNKPMPFLCQREAIDLQKCYDEKISGASKLDKIDGDFDRDTVDDCSAICGPDCFGFKFDNEVNKCTMMSYTADAKPGRRNPHYTKALLDIEAYNMVATIEAANLCSSAVAAGEPKYAVTTNVDVPDVTSSNTLQSSYGAVVDVTTDIANPNLLSSDLAGEARNAATTTIDAPVMLSSSTYQSSYGTDVDTTTVIANRLSSNLALLDIEAYNMVATIEAANLCSSAVAAGEPKYAVTTNVDVPDVTSSNTLQSSYGAVVDVTTDIANPNLLSSDLAGEARNAATTTIDAPVMLSSSTYQSSYGTGVDTTTVIANRLSSNLDVQSACSSHDSVSLESTCYCSCEEENKPTETPEELKEKIKKMNSELLINKKDLSSWKRKLISAPDQRVSAKGIGLFGVGILISLGIALVILDLPALVGEHQRLMNRFKKCRNLSIVL